LVYLEHFSALSGIEVPTTDLRKDMGMYSHILVPLDGSKLAEQILPYAKKLAAMNKDTIITLLRAEPPVYTIATEYSATFFVPVEEIYAKKTEAEDYLNNIANQLRTEGYNVQIEISELPAADAIVDYADQHEVKLIAIATHGRSGISRWIFGSVTQKVIHATHVPILIIRPNEEEIEA